MSPFAKLPSIQDASTIPCREPDEYGKGGSPTGGHFWVDMPLRMAYMVDGGTCTKFETYCRYCGLRVSNEQ